MTQLGSPTAMLARFAEPQAAPEHPLRAALVRAVCVSDSLALAYNCNASEAEIDALEDERWASEQALIGEFRKLGITPDWAAKIGSVL